MNGWRNPVDQKDAGEMGAAHSVTALYELIPAGRTIDVPSIDPLKYQQPSSLSAASTPAEAMRVKRRYKRPDEDVSTKLDLPVKLGNYSVGEAFVRTVQSKWSSS
jgi:Ca-activated chloride channel homolog